MCVADRAPTAAPTAARPTGDRQAAGASSQHRDDTSSDEGVALSPAVPKRGSAKNNVKRRPATACEVRGTGAGASSLSEPSDRADAMETGRTLSPGLANPGKPVGRLL